MRAVVLVPDRDYPHAYGWAYDVEAGALESGGFTVEPRPWTEVGNLDDADVVLPLVVWGYHFDMPRWLALLDELEQRGIPVLNPVPVLRWSSDKSYLRQLAALGVPTVPTLEFDDLDECGLAGAFDRFGDTIVIKPTVSAAADGTHRLSRGEGLPDDARGRAMMVQPFLRSVAEEGEYSLLLFDGQFSHALVKRPKSGDYRVQPHLGGTETSCEPPEGAVDLAKKALAAAPGATAYARVDLIRLDDGTLAIMELELVEPSLWLDLAPDKGASFAAAIRRALEQPLT